jgi:hypothetical protein
MLSTWPVPSIREGMELSLERWQPVGFHGNEDHAAFDLVGLQANRISLSSRASLRHSPNTWTGAATT